MLVAFAALGGAAAYIVPASCHAEAAPIYEIKIPPDTVTGGYVIGL